MVQLAISRPQAYPRAAGAPRLPTVTATGQKFGERRVKEVVVLVLSERSERSSSSSRRAERIEDEDEHDGSRTAETQGVAEPAVRGDVAVAPRLNGNVGAGRRE